MKKNCLNKNVKKQHCSVFQRDDGGLLAADGKAVHQMMKEQGYFDFIRCRDCLGGLRFEYNLKTGRKTA